MFPPCNMVSPKMGKIPHRWQSWYPDPYHIFFVELCNLWKKCIEHCEKRIGCRLICISLLFSIECILSKIFGKKHFRSLFFQNCGQNRSHRRVQNYPCCTAHYYEGGHSKANHLVLDTTRSPIFLKIGVLEEFRVKIPKIEKVFFTKGVRITFP